MKEKEYVKQRIDEAEKELREIFTDLIYDHGDNDGHYELSNRGSGLAVAREETRAGAKEASST